MQHLKILFPIIGLLVPAHGMASDHTTQLEKFPPIVDLSFKPGTERDLNEANLIAPLKQANDELWFFNLRGQLTDRRFGEVNLGLAHRQIVVPKTDFKTSFLGEEYIIGNYGFLDIRKTQFGNTFFQGTVGTELLTQHFDLRVNVYAPITSPKSISPQNIEVIPQPDTIHISYEDREKAMAGFDAEVGFDASAVLPSIFREDRLKLFFGGYQFDANGLEKMSGKRMRFEFRVNREDNPLQQLVPRNTQLTLGYEIQNDNIRGTEAFAKVNLRIPLAEAAEARADFNNFRSRLVDPVIRDVDIVTANATTHETALDAKTDKPLNGVIRVTDAVELFDATSNGKSSTIVIVEEDITTSLTNQLQPHQHITSGIQPIELKTASGLRATYHPQSNGSKSTVSQTQQNDPVFVGAPFATISNLDLVQIGSDGVEIKNAPVVNMPKLAIIKEHEQILGQVSVANSDATGAVSYSLACDAADEHSEYSDQVNRCKTGFEIDPETGVIRTTDKMDPAKFDSVILPVSVESEKGKTATWYADTLSSTGLEKAINSETLTQESAAGGIRLVYGDAYLCGGDKDLETGTCTTPNGANRIKYVQRIIEALLRHDSENSNGAISKALSKNKATMVLFNNPDDLENSPELFSYYLNSQDLQADEVFLGGATGSGTNQDGTKRDAAVEELVHLIHNYGISYARPDIQLRLDKATQAALDENRLVFSEDSGDLPRRDLDDEYLAEGVEAYFNLRGAGDYIPTDSVCSSGGIAGGKCTGNRTSRSELKKHHRALYDIIEEVFGSRGNLL